MIELQVEHIRRGIDGAKGTVDIKGRDCERNRKPLTDDDLKNIAGPDILLTSLDNLLESLLGEV